MLVVQLGKHCTGVLREWEGAGGPENPLTVQGRAGWEPFPSVPQQCQAGVTLPVVVWQDRMTQLCPAQALPDFNHLFSPYTGL